VSIYAKNTSRRVTFFFIASRRPGKQLALASEGLLARIAQAYQIMPKVAGFPDFP
jgi:hypothetical protein